MRSSTFRAVTIAGAAAIAFAACSSHGVVPSSTAFNPMASSGAASNGAMLPFAEPALTTCATSPPQYLWIFKGACNKFVLKPTGSTFKLAKYNDISVTGKIGKNTVHGSAVIYLADAIGKGDVKSYKGAPFPKYSVHGIDAFVYASAVNQSNQVIKPITQPGKPVLQYVITDTKGFSGKNCDGAALERSHAGKFGWVNFPGAIFHPVGHTLTVSQYTAPAGLELAPKTPLYVAVFCH